MVCLDDVVEIFRSAVLSVAAQFTFTLQPMNGFGYEPSLSVAIECGGQHRIVFMFSAAQLRVILRALVNVAPYIFDDVVEQLTANDENNQQTSEEILLPTIDGLPDDKQIRFAPRLVFTGHTAIPLENEINLLTETEAAFTPPQPKKTLSKKTKTPTPIETAQNEFAMRTRSILRSQSQVDSRFVHNRLRTQR